ncbi:MAG: shikimate kinase, partial [Defluviitaleaceae bacterium]|nr:shikimate kinase [Defluviitaleaceae bacterium]
MHCGLLGRKLSHSLSPDIHAAFGYDYSLFEVEPQNLASFFAEKNFHGINVTIPYKQDVIPFCDELSPVAREIGSVNTILRRADGSLFGDNTDAEGFRAMLRQSCIAVAGKKVLVLGSGGSSLTVCHVLEEQSASEITVISRQGKHTYDTLDYHRDAQILINTTPV